MTVTHFGVRHHGPGSARALERALAELEPDVVLIEGPPDADAILPAAAGEGMVPPVALLVYAPDDPRRSAFWPYAAFSPEWRAILHALGRGVPVRFIDLPAVHWLGSDDEDERRGPGRLRTDPLGVLAETAGHGDAERWWEDVVEHRRDELAAFEAVAEAMGALREGREPETPHEARREAWMRRAIRAAGKEFERIAVVCGAWHVPALADMPTKTADDRVLKGLPRRKVAATWVPWTYDRLAYASGYGAGVLSPGWYDHLFAAEDDVVVRWLTKTAHLLRAEDVDLSSAHVLEAARTADALATLRGRPLAGLPELVDATVAVIGEGADAALRLVREQLIGGVRLGEVPADTPVVPLQADVEREQRRLRLKPAAGAKRIDLDLRKEGDRARSHLLHRLALLGVDWGDVVEATGARGTFHELWDLQWRPEYAVRLIEASMWGTTVQAAATAWVRDAVEKADGMEALTTLVEATLLAELPEATAAAMRAFERRAAVGSDVAQLMDALPPLARVVRYGSVRETDVGAITGVVDGLAVRIMVGLAGAVSALDDDGAGEMRRRISAVHTALALFEREDLRTSWEAALEAIVARSDVHGLVTGRATRLLMDAGAMAPEEAARRLSLALSPGTAPAHAAAWIEGFLSGGGDVLVHDDALLGVLDDWVSAVDAEAFRDSLAVLRRTFATFEQAARRQVGERLARGARGGARTADGDGELDEERAAQVLPLLARILGVEHG